MDHRAAQLHDKHPIVAELARRTPVPAICLVNVTLGVWPWWSLAVVVVTTLLAVLWAYRPNGHGTRLLEANRTNPRRGFDWVTDQSPGPADDPARS